MIFKRIVFCHRAFLFGFLFFMFFLPFFAGCENRPAKLQTQDLTIQKRDNSAVTLTAEIAKTREELTKGLMYREQLAAGEGMLFVFDRDQIMSFWMQNTFIPLSIAYISADGIILEIYDMKPHNEIPVVSTRSARYALEVPQGWFKAEGIQTGDKLLLKDLR